MNIQFATLKNRLKRRKGAIAVMSALFLTTMMGMVGFAVDYGYLTTAKSELQRSADAAAMAGAWELIATTPTGSNVTNNFPACRTSAVTYAGKNKVCNTTPVIGSNSVNDPSGDVVLGYLTNSVQGSAVMSYTDPTKYNAVQVTVSKTSGQNGQVPLFFAKIFGFNGLNMTATGRAAFVNNVSGFNMPSDGSTLKALPLAMKKSDWLTAFSSGPGCGPSAPDNWKWNESTGTLSAGSDGKHEIKLFPSGPGVAGNLGTVDIGNASNSTANLASQILNGVTQADLNYIGGSLKLTNGTLPLNGDTGLSASIQNELSSIIGKPRFIPIYNTVVSPGNNATFTIVGFAGIRILEVQLNGNNKHVTVQPANIIVENPVPSDSLTTFSYGIYSPVRLVQ